jgi:hypothetical protein
MVAYKLAELSVVTEVIDGEAIIVDMRSGCYFSTDGLGARLWQAALAGSSRATIKAAVAAAYPTIAEAADAAAAFLDKLVEHDLLAVSDEATTDVSFDLDGTSYAPPTLEHHSDMQDLIMLDPIHDVDTMGWPTRKEDTKPLS